MARFRRARRRRGSFSLARRSSRRSGGDGGKVLIGLGLTSTADQLITNVAGGMLGGISPPILRMGAGYFLSRKSGYLKGIGYGLFARGAADLVPNLLHGGLGGLFGAAPAAPASAASGGANW